VGGTAAAGDDIVPIGALFPDDGMPGLVSAAPSPPTTASQRFRLEVVSHAEHLRRLVADASCAQDSATRERVARELAGAATALSRLSVSFGESDLAAFFEGQRAQAALLANAALHALDRASALLSSPHGKPTVEIVRALQAAASAPAFSAPAVEATAPAAEAAAPPARVPRPSPIDIAALAPDGEPSLVSVAGAPSAGGAPVTGDHAVGAPSGDALNAMLASGLAGLSALDENPLAAPAEIASDVVVPIEDLVYRGRDALDRAIELRDQLRQSPGAPDPAMLNELFDLLELAATSE
jgi:hypothetical protein